MTLKYKIENAIYLDICSERHLSKYSKQINYIEYVCKEKDTPAELEKILISILLIETYYRNLVFRIIEYLFVLGISSILLNIPIKNYTIGVCQIGLSYILKYHGFEMYEHVRFIKVLDFSMLKSILSSINYKKNIEVSLWRTMNYYQKLMIFSDERLIARRIGEKYNGTYEYGLLVEKINNELSNLCLEPDF